MFSLIAVGCHPKPKPNNPPSVNAGADRAVISGTLVHLNGSATDTDPGDGIGALGWVFISRPPGSSATLKDSTTVTPSFVADVIGEYLLELVATDYRGERSRDRVLVRAGGAVDEDADGVPDTLDRCLGTPTGARVDAHGCAASQLPALRIALVANPVSGRAPLSVNFTSQASGGSGGYTFAWAFGDGQTSTLRDPTHTYSVAGNYNPAVTVTDTLGSTAQASSTLVVSSASTLVSVPNLVGQTQAAATAAIIAAQLVVGSISSASNATVPAGHVMSQSPTAGTTVAQGSAVSLVVSTGPSGTGLPPDPSTVAPPIDPTVATDIASATSFLYTGANPIQTGVAPGTIEARRVAVLRGKVQGRDGSALPGIRISVLGHPELGQTFTRADGAFDLAVNGGGHVTLHYAKDGFLAVQRAVVAPWRDYAWLPDVVMVPFDTTVTAVDLSVSSLQTARGSVVSDADGARRATVLFPPGTTATMVLPNGTTQPLTTLNVRVTEYTVGGSGPKAMPAPLPPSSGYTYAAELSLDEAVAAGATDVRFSRALPVYIENFLGFPVGGIAPIGFYDKAKAAWVASDNGRVIKVLSITAGLADLDIDGSGQPANATALAALGATDAERQQLATLYASGQSLWRVPVPHFSSMDINWPYRPDCDSAVQICEPNQPTPQGDDPLDNQNEECGSVIGCENQTLGESVSVSGTSSRLHYRSDRTPGRKAAYNLSIPLSGATRPATLRRIDLVVSVAGRQFRQSFPAAINQRTTFTWDGRDAYGRPVQGQRPVSVRIGYVYGAVKLQPGEGSTGAFGVLSFSGRPVSADIARQEIIFWQEWRSSIGPWDARAAGLGGATLNVHHAYDPAGKVLLLGDGTRRNARSLPDVITTVAGNGNFCFSGPCGDGGPATQASLTISDTIAIGPDGSLYIPDRDGSRIRRVGPNGIISTIVGGSGRGYSGDGGLAISAKVAAPEGVAVGPDGSLYIADTRNHRIRRVGLDGIIATVAGNGTFATQVSSPPGDGGPATQAEVSEPRFITVGPDGSLYIATPAYQRIRKVSPDGIITTLAGTGKRCSPSEPCGDGGPAGQATFFQPRGIALGSDGSLYIADTLASRIRRIAPDGQMSTVAGRITSENGFEGDGGPATDALFNVPNTVAVGPDGSLYIADENNGRVRRVGPDGIITTVAGNGSLHFSGDGGPATQAGLTNFDHAVVGPDGGLFIWGSNSRRVRRVAPILPGFTAGDLVLSAEDGSEVYVFDNVGRHLKTLDALTGTARDQFSYSTDGYLTSITDASGNVTTVERTGTKPTAIVAPGGQRTALNVSDKGWLLGVTNPASEAHSMSYSDDGLLQTFTDPRNNIHRFTYDTLGRVIKDEDPAGGSTSLARTEQGNGYTVTTTSALGRNHIYQVEQLSTGALRRTVTAPNGAKTVTLINSDGSEHTTNPDGSSNAVQYEPDPRWGMLARVPKSVSVTTAGTTANLTTTRTASLASPNNPLSLRTLTDTVTLNDRTFTTVYDAATKTATSTSAAGRQNKAGIDSLGRVVQVQLGGLLANSLSYDTPRGRLATVTQGTGVDARTATLSYNPDNTLSVVTDPLGRKVSFIYDTAGRVTSQTFPDGREIVYAYDANGKLTSLTPPGRPGHLFRYTARDQTEEYKPPLVAGTGNTLYDYDLDKALTKITRPDGQTLNLTYDPGKRRLTTLTLPIGQINYAYDATTGKLTGVTAPDGSALAYTYNDALLTRTAWTGTVAGNMDRSYDNDFRVTSLSVNGANAITFQYDADSLLTKAGDLALTRSDQNGLLTGTALGSVTDSYTYDGFAEVTAYEAKYSTSSLLRFEYEHDKLGRITQKRQIQGGVTHTFEYGYDTAGRLVEVKRDGVITTSYGYDANGNRTHLNGALVAHYDDQDRLLDYQGVAYQYTANGELRQKTVAGQTTRYDYDVLGNLRKVTFPNGTVIDYVIDGQNRRIGKKRNGTLEQSFLYQSPLQPIAELDGSGAVVSRFVYATGINVPEYMIKGGITYRIIKDHLGSPRLVVEMATNTVAQEMDYDVFGNVTLDTNPGFQPFGFAGGLYDRDTKLVRFGARDYEAESGRWTAKDPIWFGGGDVNLFGYVLDNPVNSKDVFGLADGGVDIVINDTGGRFGPPYGGTLTVTNPDGGTVTVNASSWPNPTNPSPGIAPGTYPATYSPTGHQGITNGVRLNNGTAIPTNNNEPNPAQDGGTIATGINIHCGNTAANRGSAGCITVNPAQCQPLWNVLSPGPVTVTLRRISPDAGSPDAGL